MSDELRYRTQSFDLPPIPVTTDQPLGASVEGVLDELFNLTNENPFRKESHNNMFFYLNPVSQEFISSRMNVDDDQRTADKQAYMDLLHTTFQNRNGSVTIREEIFGIETADGTIRTSTNPNEYTFKFMQQLSMNDPLCLCVLQLDQFMPQITYVKPELN